MEEEIIGGFDYRAHLRARRIYGKIFTSSADVTLLDQNRANIFMLSSNKMRRALIRRVNEIMPERTAGLLTRNFNSEKEQTYQMKLERVSTKLD